MHVCTAHVNDVGSVVLEAEHSSGAVSPSFRDRAFRAILSVEVDLAVVTKTRYGRFNTLSKNWDDIVIYLSEADK